MVNKCKNCFFYRTSYLYNSCGYFETEYYNEPDECVAFSRNGYLSPEIENKIYNETDGAYGKSLFNKPNFTNYTSDGYPN